MVTFVRMLTVPVAMTFPVRAHATMRADAFYVVV
jgi:hypothetical protein